MPELSPSTSLSVLNVLLVLLTILFTARSYASQVRTNVRESLEQLDDIEYEDRDRRKLKPILNEFDFGWIHHASLGVVGPRPRSEILLKEYRAGTHGQWASRTAEVSEEAELRTRKTATLSKKLKRVEGGERTALTKLPETRIEGRTGEGLVVTVYSRNPVEVRRAADLIMVGINREYLT